MKKFISGILILSLVMLSFNMPIDTKAATSASITVDSANGNHEDTIAVSVNISKNSNVQALGFQLEYDKDVLELVTATKGAVTASTQTIVNSSSLGKIVFSCVSSSSGITSAGSLLDLEFKIKSTAVYGNSTLHVDVTEASDGDFNVINMTVQDGIVTVNAPQLTPPDNLTVDQIYSNALVVSWDYVEEASGYNIYLDGSRVNDEMITVPGYTIVDLQALTTYQIQVTSINYTVESELSELIEVTTLATQYTVEFYDENNELIESINVEEGNSITPPTAPTKEGYIFDAWRIVSYDSDRGTAVNDFSAITSNMVLIASYVERTFTVNFVDWDGTVISTQVVTYGEAATAPDTPTRTGYNFVGWDTSFESVYENLTVTATYVEMECLHTNTEVQNAKESTCAETGYGGDVVCIDCGSTIATGAELELAEHKYHSVITEPTTSSQGYTTYICEVCGDSYVDSYTDYVDENDPQIVVESKKNVAGKTVTVDIAIKNNPGIASAMLTLDFDTSALTLVDVTDAGNLGIQCHKPELTSPYTLAWMNDTATEDFTFNGTIVTLTFEIAEDAEVGDYTIDLSYDYDNYDIWNVNVEKVKFAAVDGVITVIDTIIGDINGDGAVNTLDRMNLARYLANWEGYTAETIDLVAADVNGDGVINTLDRMALARHLANWSGYETLPCEI